MKTKIGAIFAVSIMSLVGSMSYGDNPKQPVQNISFEELKEACRNPARFHNQLAPSDIQVACTDTQYKWVPDVDGSLSLGTARYVKTSVQSDKYATAPVTGGVPCSPQLVGCAKHKEIVESLQTVRGVSCNELLAFQGGAIDFCSGVINDLRAANPEAISAQATGRTVSLCGAKQEQAKPDQGQGPVPGQG